MLRGSFDWFRCFTNVPPLHLRFVFNCNLQEYSLALYKLRLKTPQINNYFVEKNANPSCHTTISTSLIGSLQEDQLPEEGGA
jgi:hypothetical protein